MIAAFVNSSVSNPLFSTTLLPPYAPIILISAPVRSCAAAVAVFTIEGSTTVLGPLTSTNDDGEQAAKTSALAPMVITIRHPHRDRVTLRNKPQSILGMIRVQG
jgi:hypothetical protein